MKLASFAVTLLLWGGCASRSGVESLVSPETDAVETVIAVPQGSTPRLGTNEVLRIARETSEGRRFKTNEYHCETVLFQAAPTNDGVSGTWLLHYVTKPAAPDMDFFVIVNDDSGKAELWVP